MAALAFVFCLGGTRASAQANEPEGLEQTYARLCGKGQKSETCTALRQALLTKLSGESTSPGTSADVKASAGASKTAAPPASTPYWGHYLDFVKEPRVSVLVEGMYDVAYGSPITTYSWEVPGQVMSVSNTQPDGSITRVATVRWDEQRRALVSKSLSDGSESVWMPQPDGSLMQQSDKVRIIERKFNNGTVEQRTEAKRDSVWEVMWVYHHVVYRPETIGLLRQIHANAVEVAKISARIPAKYRDPAYQRIVQERAAARAAENGGFFRAVLGAAIGVAAGSAAGMDAAQTVGVAAKGVALMNPESQLAQAVGASGDAILQNSGLGTAAAGKASAGVRGPASYPTRPNELTGEPACAMMNEANYRQVGVSGGNDVQLKTMCAQAYEYYTMYKRAIAQGYSEADANRTYAAHQQAAKNAIAYYANNKAQ